MPNALADETSPYLLQHKDNPVAWLPWSDDVFEQAKREGKLVFLSVGYSTCHWCHVMERESFENERVAGVMNRHFINVKVDREERPDVDAAYMAFVQLTTGQGGWPMSVWLTPEGKPVFGGTYFPPDDGHCRPGFVRVCHELARLWNDDREKLLDSAAKVTAHLQLSPDQDTGKLELDEIFYGFLRGCESMFDQDQGGFGGAPKFPRPCLLRTLMQLGDRWGFSTDAGAKARGMVEQTLRAMAAGGIRDHLAGGFHRYSVDRFWHVPHYEKMLYDQAQLVHAYLDAWQVSGDRFFKDVACETLDWLLAEMLDPCGAFHAAEDADSLPEHDSVEKREGAFWTWCKQKIEAVLGDDAEDFCRAYGVLEGGNARPESDPHGELTGQNTLFLTDPKLAGERLDGMKAMLLNHRNRRPRPHRDDKLITAWNGLAIGAFARAGRTLQNKRYAGVAIRAAEFLKQYSWDGARLRRSFRKHRGSAPGFPADYAFLIEGLLELHGLDSSISWLKWADELQQAMDREYYDDTENTYLVKHRIGETALWNVREDYDGAEPAPPHVAARNLQALAVLLDRDAYATRAEALLVSAQSALENPFAAPVLLGSLDLQDRGLAKIQLADDHDLPAMQKLRKTYLPRAVFTSGGGDQVLLCEGLSCHVFC
jgi:hypothetical protein